MKCGQKTRGHPRNNGGRFKGSLFDDNDDVIAAEADFSTIATGLIVQM